MYYRTPVSRHKVQVSNFDNFLVLQIEGQQTMRIESLWVPVIYFYSIFFERGALTTIFGVAEPHMDDYTKFHPKLYIFVPNLTLCPMKRPRTMIVIFLKS